jgi:zinc D-Ala-D-Ala carboxypeptidase
VGKSYFTLREMIHSDTAVANDIHNIPDFDAVAGLLALRDRVLDPVRIKLEKPMHLSCAYRCPALNELVGGVPTSQHVATALYAAADIDQGSIEANKYLFDTIRSGFVFDQLISECGGKWIHVSYRTDGRNRQQVMGV